MLVPSKLSLLITLHKIDFARGVSGHGAVSDVAGGIDVRARQDLQQSRLRA